MCLLITEVHPVTSALFGILQLDKGEPYGYAEVPGLVQMWLQNAGGFAMIGLVVYLLYALLTPTDKSESQKIRVPVSMWMVSCAAIAALCYVAFAALFVLSYRGYPTLLGQPLAVPPRPLPLPGMPIVPAVPTFHTELQELARMFAGLFAILGIAEPFAREVARLVGRNFSFGGIARFVRAGASYTGGLFTTRRLTVLGICVGLYAALGVVVYLVTPNLFGYYLGVCGVAATVLVLAFLALIIFEAEGPVWAVAKLSFKEAVRSQLLWVFLIICLPFLFPASWFERYKASDELRVTVDRVSMYLTLLVLVPAVLLASFGIPNDIKNLNIYTVVTKPIERFEMVLGRFLGYVSLMTLVLIGLTGVSLVLVANSPISQKAKDETYKARVPVRGKLEFKGLIAALRDFDNQQEFKGTNVGREFDYRKYIAGSPQALQRGIWHFTSLPKDLKNPQGDRIPVEYTFDIFKLTKGEQNKGVGVYLRFVSHHAAQQQPKARSGDGEWHWEDPAKEKAYRDAKEALERGSIKMDSVRPGLPGWAEINKLAEDHGCFERHVQVFDYQIGGVEIPAGLIRSALSGDPGTMKVKDPDTGQEKVVPAPRLSIYVKCETPGQQLGMAQPDLYLLEYEQRFELNYIKGMVGLWCWLCIIVGVAVTWSTYLTGVLTLIAALVIFLCGFTTDFVRELSAGRNVGGGPFQSMSQIISAQQPTAPLADTSSAKALTMLDRVAGWGFAQVLKVLPDLEKSDWGDFVSEGYNINTEYLVVNLLTTLGYLLPWALLAYWMMKLREVAA